MTDNLSKIFYTCYIPLKQTYESYEIKWDNIIIRLKEKKYSL